MTALTVERLRALLSYDPQTGIFKWRVTRGPSAVAGDTARSQNGNGYLRIRIDGRKYYAHRLAWLYVHGRWPLGNIDHKDTVVSHNWIENLREATQSQNAANASRSHSNRSGFKGVSWHARAARWAAKITVRRRDTYLGLFNTAEEAHAAYSVAAREAFGEFARPQEADNAEAG